MGKKRKSQHHHHAIPPPHPPPGPPGSYTSLTPTSSAPRARSHIPSIARPSNHNNSNTSLPLITSQSNATKKSPLAEKFALLEAAIAGVLAEKDASDEEWKEALGNGSGSESEKRVEFVNALKGLRRSGELSWVDIGSGIETSRTSSTSAITYNNNNPSTSTAAPGTPSIPSQNQTWPPPLPRITSPALITQVFTHPSHLSAQTPSTLSTDLSTTNYQRLEFLGDSALRYILARTLYHRFPTARENILATLRSSLESNQNLYHYSTVYSLPSRVRIGKEALQAGTHRQKKFCADVFEAYIGALCLDDPSPNGFNKLESWLVQLIEPKLRSGAQQIGDTYIIDRAAREKLSKIVAGVKGVSLEYTWEGGGGGNEGGFWYVVYLTGYGYEKLELGRGWGSNKGDAMLRAAMKALENEGVIEEVRERRDEFLRMMGVEKKEKVGGKNVEGDSGIVGISADTGADQKG